MAILHVNETVSRLPEIGMKNPFSRHDHFLHLAKAQLLEKYRFLLPSKCEGFVKELKDTISFNKISYNI